MAKDRVIIRLREMRSARARVGRANITIDRWGDLNSGRLGLAIAEYKAGEIGAEELCWAFAKARVESHTPSFSWDDADLTRVLEVVATASTEPKFDSTAPEAVAAVLVQAAQLEAEELKESLAKMRLNVDAVLGRGHYDAFAGLRTMGAAKYGLGLNGLFDKHFAITNNISRQVMGAAGANLSRQVMGVAGVDQFRKVAGMDIGGSAWRQLAGRNFAISGAITNAMNPRLFETPPWLRNLPDPSKLFHDFEKFEKLSRSWADAYKRTLPPNWRELESEEIDAVVELMTAEGLSMAWAPRMEIIRSLLDAKDHQGRCLVLEGNRTEIVEDVQGVLEEIDRDDLQPVVGACQEAIDTWNDGHPDPAQAYAATAIGELVHGPLGWEGFGNVRKIFAGKDPMHDVGFGDFPLFAVGGAWVRVLDRFDDAGEGFNRNLTQHRIGFPYSQANLLTVLMLLAGLLGELQRALKRHDARQLEEAA